ncbi:MAG TPA: hypothetical protein VNH15_08270 [Elusimicrobiota bacterium]|nr:hypothetical protein [Elusimicrobiota bacterium]
MTPDFALDFAAAGASLAAGAALLFGAHLSWAVLAVLALALAAWRLGSCFFTAATAHLALDLFSRPGSASGVFKIASEAELSWTLLVPAALIARWAAPGSIAAAAGLLFAAWLLNAGLRAQALARERGVSRLAAALSFLWPCLAIAGLGAILVLGVAAAALAQFHMMAVSL